MISALDTKILEVIENDKEIEAEVIQTEETACLISTAKVKITSYLSSNAPAGKIALSTHMTLSPSTEHHVDSGANFVLYLSKLHNIVASSYIAT